MKEDASYNILDRIRQEQQLNPGFTVPDNYFESLSGRLMAAIRETDTDNTPVLDGISRIMPYHVPQYYFARLRVNRARVVDFKKGLTIAASFILLAVSSIFLLTPRSPASTAGVATVNELTNEQLERFIQPDEATPRDKAITTHAVKIPNTDMATLLKNVPDAELTNFLNETAEGTEEIFLN